MTDGETVMLLKSEDTCWLPCRIWTSYKGQRIPSWLCEVPGSAPCGVSVSGDSPHPEKRTTIASAVARLSPAPGNGVTDILTETETTKLHLEGTFLLKVFDPL